MNLLDHFRNGLEKTRKLIAGGVTRIGATMGYFDDAMLDELETVLVQADVGAQGAMHMMDKVRAEIRRTGDNSRAFVIDALKQEMCSILGDDRKLTLVPGKLNILILVGVNGTGKTTTAGKLCLRFTSQGKTVLLAAADTFRAAAIEQLRHWGEQHNTPVIAHETGSDPGAVAFDAVHSAINRRSDVLIVDTAGRLHNKQNLMDELGKIERIARREAPDASFQILLVIDATTGQNAVVQAKVFNDVTKLSGIVLTKLDSNAKGGIAVSVVNETKIPVILAGLGEKAEDLVDFERESFVESLF
jgi:fused signal recognition particle receptor